MKKLIFHTFLALVLLPSPAAPAQSRIAYSPGPSSFSGVSVSHETEIVSPFNTRFVITVIPADHYSKESLLKLWAHYCARYTDKGERLDLRVYAEEDWRQDRQIITLGGPPGDDYLARFERMIEGPRIYGGDEEFLVYAPDIGKPDNKIKVVLVGKDSYKK